MQSVINDFEDRVKELNSFFTLLRRLEGTDELVSHSGAKPVTSPVRAEWRATLKAMAYLLIYNMVEASIREATTYLYGRLRSRDLGANRLRDEMVAIWVEQEFRSKDAFTASPRNYFDLTRNLVNHAASRAAIDIKCDDLPMAGNLDGQSIMKLCQKHGMIFKIPKTAKGGSGLINVKANRNALAHGSLSFEECGRTITVAQLDQVRRETVVFVRAVLRSFRNYTSRRQYLKAS